MARVRYEMTDPKINEMFDTLFSGHALVVSSSGDVVATLVEKVIEISGNKKVTVPEASADNKGKEYIVYFSANAKTGGGIVDDADSPNTIVAQALCLNKSSFDLVSTGTAWKAVPMALGTDS